MKLGLGFAACAFAFAIAGCSEHFDRRDGLTRASGDAQAINAATQTIDPWPPAAWHTRHSRDGKRTLKVIEAYQRGSVASSGTSSGDGAKKQEENGEEGSGN